MCWGGAQKKLLQHIFPIVFYGSVNICHRNSNIKTLLYVFFIISFIFLKEGTIFLNFTY